MKSPCSKDCTVRSGRHRATAPVQLIKSITKPMPKDWKREPKELAFIWMQRTKEDSQSKGGTARTGEGEPCMKKNGSR